MTQYNNLNIKMSNAQINKLKSGKKCSTEGTLKSFLKCFLCFQ